MQDRQASAPASGRSRQVIAQTMQAGGSSRSVNADRVRAGIHALTHGAPILVAVNPTDDIDLRAVLRQQARRSRRGCGDPLLRGEVEQAMLSRLEPVRIEPACVLDTACGTGSALMALARRFPGARTIGFDLSARALSRAARDLAPPAGGWLGRLLAPLRAAGRPAAAGEPWLAGADPCRLPLAGASVDLVWSSLMLHWYRDPTPLLAEWYRIIRPGGLLGFSCLGVDTLAQLRSLGARLMPFPDMHDLGDALVTAGFAEPVLDTERLTVTWRDPVDLLADLRSLGGNAMAGRKRGLATPGERRRWLDALDRLRGPDGLIGISFELVYGHAWCPAHKRLPEGLAPLKFLPRPR
jgi:malonyl-CoA O-methyltransferase